MHYIDVSLVSPIYTAVGSRYPADPGTSRFAERSHVDVASSKSSQRKSWSKKGVRLAQKMQVGPRIPVGIQL